MSSVGGGARRGLLRWGVHAKLLALALAALLPALLLGALDSTVYLARERQAARASVLVTAQLAAQQTRELARGTESFLRALGEVDVVRNGTPEQRDELFAALVGTSARYNALYLLAPDGRELGISTHVPGAPRLEAGGRPYFQEALRSSGFFVTRDPVQAQSTGAVIVPMLLPLRDERGDLLGLLGVGARLARLQEVWEALDLLPGATVSLVQRDTGLGLARDQAAEGFVGQPVDEALAARLRAEAAGTFEQVYADGVERLAAFAEVESTPWAIVVEVPTASLFAEWRAGVTRTALLLSVGGALALGLALLLAARLAVPTRQLARAATALGAGRLDHRVAIRSHDELQLVGEHFNAMAEQLQRDRAELEQRVADATAAERRRARQRQALQEAAAALVSQLDRDAVLGQIVAIAERLLEVPAWNVMLLHGDELVWTVTHNMDPAWMERRNRRVGESLSGWVAQHRRPLAVPDMLADARFTGAHFAQSSGMRSYLGAPLLVGDRLLGVLNGYAPEVRHFDDDEVELLAAFANHAAIALANADAFGDLERTQAELRGALRARDEFLSIASHELRTPVAGVKAAAQLLLRARARGTLDEARLDRSLQALNSSADRIARLTDDLLDVARLRTGRLSLEPGPLDLLGLVQEVVDRGLDQREDGAHRVVVDAAPDLGLVEADAGRLDQVVTNLVDNAVKYSPAGGEVRLTLRRLDEGVRLDVADQGIGLPPGSEAAIFEPFGRAPNAAARQVPGMGLGLFICREIVERHGGRIWAESPGEDRGTTVSLWLPARPSATDPPPDGRAAHVLAA